MQRSTIIITLPLLFTIGCGVNPCDPSSPLYPGAVAGGHCNDNNGETGGNEGWDEDVSDPDDAKAENLWQFDTGCREEVLVYEAWRVDHGLDPLGPLDDQGESTFISGWEYAPYLIASPGDTPLDVLGRPHIPGLPNEFTCAEATAAGWGDSHRTCLVGNFAAYMTGFLPSSHPRPPILHQIIWQIGNPEQWGRVTGVGDPCCGVVTEEQLDDPNVPNSSKADPTWAATNNLDCVEHITTQMTAPMDEYPRPNLGGLSQEVLDEQEVAEASAYTQCLNNGGEFDGPEIAESSVYRNGLVWLNLGAGLQDDLFNWAQGLDDNIPYFGEIATLLGLIDWYGFEDEVEDPPFFGFMGVCANRCSVQRLVTQGGVQSWWSGTECPGDQYCVVPDFNPAGYQSEIVGFCTIENWTPPLPPPDNIGNMQPLDVYPHAEAEGLPHHYTVNLTNFDLDGDPTNNLDEIVDGLSVSWDAGAGAWVVGNATNTLARRLGTATDIQPGDRVLFVAGVAMGERVDLGVVNNAVVSKINDAKFVRIVHERTDSAGQVMRRTTHLKFRYLGSEEVTP